LETAMQGVERFSLSSDRLERLLGEVPKYAPEPIEIRSEPNARPFEPQTSRSSVALNLVLFAVGGLLAGSVVAAADLTACRASASPLIVAGEPKRTPASNTPAAPKDVSQPSFPIPTDYAVYALNNGTLMN
jgi:hypothetical protein